MSFWTRLSKLFNISSTHTKRVANPRPGKRRRGCMLMLEQLEDRTTPSFGLSALHLGTSTGSIDYDYTVGTKIVPTGTVDAGKYYDLVLTRSDNSTTTV